MTLNHGAIYISYSLSTWNENRLDGFGKPALTKYGGGETDPCGMFFKCPKVQFHGEPELGVKNVP